MNIIFKLNNKTFVGQIIINNGLEEIVSFKPFPYHRHIEINDNTFYIVMIDDSAIVYELDKCKVSDIIEDRTELSSLSGEELVLIANKLINRHKNIYKLH